MREFVLKIGNERIVLDHCTKCGCVASEGGELDDVIDGQRRITQAGVAAVMERHRASLKQVEHALLTYADKKNWKRTGRGFVLGFPRPSHMAWYACESEPQYVAGKALVALINTGLLSGGSVHGC